MGYRQNDFINRAIARAVKNKDAKLTTAPTLDTKEAKPKESKPKDEKSKEEENPFKNPYDAFLKTWKQSDPLPLIPPGMTMHLCKFGNPLHTDTNYFDLQEEYQTKKTKVKFKHPDLKLDSKSLGPKLRDEIDTLLARSMMGKFGLKPWVDDKNKLRCPEGSPAANQFTDQRMSNCFIISPRTAAGSAGRIARRAGSAIADASQVGGRTPSGFQAARDMNNLTQQDFLDMGYDEVSSRMAVGGRIVRAMTGNGIVGAMTGNVGQRFDPSRRSTPSEPYLLGRREKTLRGKRSTMLAMTTAEMIRIGKIKLPNGDDIGDITDEATFIRVMTQMFPNVEVNEFKTYFQNAIPSNLRWEQRGEAKKGIKAFWEATIVNAIANPDQAKLVTQFLVDYNMGSAFEVKLDHFGPAIDSNGRLVSAAGKKLIAGRNAGQGGVHVIMKINPAALFQSSLGFHNGDARSGGIHDSVEGDMHYTATHEFGHLAHFSTALQALGFDVNRMTRYPSNPTHFAGAATTGGAPAWRPGKENGGWEIDFTNMRNPMNSPSIQLVMDAAQNLKTRQYMGGRGNFNSADLQKDLVEFYDAFTEAIVNNVTDTAEDLMLMVQFAGGEYAASNPIEARAEYYAARRLYGETSSQARMLTPQRYPLNIRSPRPGGRGPVNQNIRNANYVQEFADATASGVVGVRTARTGIPGAPMTSADVTRRLDNSGSGTFGVRPGTWNLTGAMDMGGGQRRVSLHAQQVQGWVKQDERTARNKNKKPKPQWQPLSAARLQSGITGAMSVEQDKPRYPREATYGSFLGDAQKIFGNAKTWEEFKKIYDETEIIFFDYETTGIEHDADGRTIDKGSPAQIGAVRMKGDKVLDRLNVFMKPDRPLGEWSAINLKDKDGNVLTDEYLDAQESMLKAHQMLADFAGENAIFGVQYAPFDKDVLDATLEKLGIQWRPSGYLDTKDISEHTLPRWTPENPEGPSKLVKEKILDDGTVIPETRKASNGLADITAYLGVDLGSKHHTADADSEAAGKVMSALIDKSIEKNLPTTVLDMKSQKSRVSKAQDDFEKEIIDFEQAVLLGNSGVTGKMSVASTPEKFQNVISESTGKSEKRREKAKDRVDGLEKAMAAFDATGEWRGGEFGVVVSRGDDITNLDGFDADITPRNLTKAEVEEEGPDKFKQRLEKKLDESRKELALQEFQEKTKKQRIEQGILDIEDVPEEDYDILVREGQELQKRIDAGDRSAFQLDGNRRAAIHVGHAQLDGGVLNPARTSGGNRGPGTPGDTGALNKSSIRGFNAEFDANAKKLATFETTMSALNAGQTKFTPRDRQEADAINSLLGTGGQYGFKAGEELDLTSLSLRDGIQPLIEHGNRRIAELQARQVRDAKLAKRINESPDFGFLSAYPASRGVTTQGYYGRDAGKDIPKDIAKYYSEIQNYERGAHSEAVDIEDQDMYPRWESNLRGSAYLVIGDQDDTVVSSLGPMSDELQLVGVNKPLFGVSSRLHSQRQPKHYDMAAHALMARAIKLNKEGIDPTPDKVLATRLYESAGPSGGITGAMQVSETSRSRSAEILSRAKEKGIDVDYWARERMPKFDNSIGLTGNEELGRQGYEKRLMQALKQAEEQGNKEKAEIINQLIREVRNMTPEELQSAVDEALKRLPPQFSQNVSVQVSDPLGVVNSGRYLTVHEVEKLEAAKIRGLSQRGNFGIETVISSRSNIEAQFLNIDSSDKSQETRDLRPASGYVTSRMSEDSRAKKLIAKYGPDVKIQHPYGVGEAASKNNDDMTAYGTSRIILKPDVAERSLVFTGDSISDTGSHSPALKLSTIDNTPHRGMWFNGVSILYADRTGDMDSIASPGSNLPKDGRGEVKYQEAMILGSFDTPDIAAIVVPPGDIRDSYGNNAEIGVNAQSSWNVTSIIRTAEKRDEFSERGIDIVMDTPMFPLDEVEPFNPTMTRQWVQEQINSGKWENVTFDEIAPDESTTPYEAWLRYKRKTQGVGSEGGGTLMFDHPDNEPGNDEKNKVNFSNMIDEELKRIESVKSKKKTSVEVSEPSGSGITGAMRTSMKISSTRKSNRKTAEIKRSINGPGGNFGGDTSVRYIKDLKPADTMLGPTLISETKAARFQERENIITALKSTVSTFIPNNEGPIAAAAAPPGQPPNDPNDPNKNPPLGDWVKHKTDAMNGLNGLSPDFHRYLNETPIEELKKELEFSILDFHEGLDKQPRTHVPGRFIKDLLENGFKNSHERNEMAGLDKILSKYEADIGIHPDTPAVLRPASGFVLHMDELQREQNDIMKFLKNSGKESPERYSPNLVDFPHSKRTRGNDWNFGNAEIILNHGVSDRTAYGNGDLFNNHIEPVGMNSSDNEVIARAHVDALFKADNRVENIIEHLYNNFKGNHDAYRKEKYATSPGRSWEPREASIAGGFNADDIDEIKIPFDSIPKNFIDGHPGSPATNSAMGKDAYIKESESFLNGIKEKIMSDDAISKIDPSEEELKIIRDILSSSPKDFVIPDKIQKSMNRFGAAEFDLKQDVDKYLRLEAAEAMKKSMDKKGIKLSITNKYGLNVFDPKAFDRKASTKATAKEAMRNKIEKQMEDLINDMREAKGRGDEGNIASGITGSMSLSRRHADRSAEMEKQFPNAEENKKRADHEAIVKAWKEQGLNWEEVPRYIADKNFSSDYLRGREVGVNQARVMWDGDSVKKRPAKFNEKAKASQDYNNWYSSYAKSISSFINANKENDSDNWNGLEAALREDVKTKYPDTQDWRKEDIETLNEYLDDIGLSTIKDKQR